MNTMFKVRGRTPLFYGILVLLVYIVIEGAAMLAYRVSSDQWFSFDVLQDDRIRVLENPVPVPSVDTSGMVRVIHPYVGFVGGGMNAFGFIDAPPLFHQPDSDTVVVAVLGGSVAFGLVRGAGSILKQALGEAPDYKGKQIYLVNLALPGMKQPQQYMIVNYFLTLGAYFDVVINLDGFNDLVLSAINDRKGTFPFYPRDWDRLMVDVTDTDYLRQVARLVDLEDRRRRGARMVSYFPLRYLVSANVLWYLNDQRLQSNWRHLNVELSNQIKGLSGRKQEQRPYFLGPEVEYSSEKERYAALADYWRRCSVLLNDLARVNGFQYFHFLQPNQYVAGSKVFTDDERAIALPEQHPYQRDARRGYPYLIEAGKTLPEEGVYYTDLTMIFSGIEEPLYRDGCCHFNQRGQELKALVMAQAVAAYQDEN